MMNKNEIIEVIKSKYIQFIDLYDIYKNDKEIFLAAIKNDIVAFFLSSIKSPRPEGLGFTVC